MFKGLTYKFNMLNIVCNDKIQEFKFKAIFTVIFTI